MEPPEIQEDILMRTKLIRLTLALAALAAAQLGIFPSPAAEATTCSNIRVCCPDTGVCYTCCRPCPIQCP